MKIQPEHYLKLKGKVFAYLDKHPEVDPNKGLTSMRYRWDIFWASTDHNVKSGDETRYTLMNEMYKYMNDDNIDTALKAILQERVNGGVKIKVTGRMKVIDKE